MFFTAAIEDVWPHLAQDGHARAARMIDRAETLILQRFPTIPQRIDAGELSKSVVAGVVEDMVTRVLERDARGGMDKLAYPEVSMEWEASGGAGTGSILYLTTDELLLLAPTATAGAFSIRPTGHEPRYPRW